ncbi:NEW3 domain-containing protein [Streptacidiphilus sp. EB129]|uniref:glycoside hydrolase family 38 N-terminal domain-containing protein n=1 Tax=Streptacidiphilus sp. EB129 TaxID=3156262 RepID=UPI0035164089
MISIAGIESTMCFTGSADHPRQVLRVVVRRGLLLGVGRGGSGGTVTVTGPGVSGSAALPSGRGSVTVEVSLDVDARWSPRDTVPLTVEAAAAGRTVRSEGVLTVAEPGWTMYLVSHFHYDPVWWNTQAAYTATWELQGNDGSTRPVWQHNGFNLVRAHLELAAEDPDYTFVLAEVDYLKPFWDVLPEYRAVLRELIAAGRVEVMGGTYNEPNTNLTGSETTIRNLVYGVGYQRDIMGADPRTAWQLDVFGHDPQFPGLAAEAGLTGSAWARGPFHQWGPLLTKFGKTGADARSMQFPAEFEWLSPSGRGVLTHYMPNHYSAGWTLASASSLAEAERRAYDLFRLLKPAAATRNILLPVGTDYAPPSSWVTEIHRDWNARYVWPRFVSGIPRDFFAAVHAELEQRGVAPSPQTRDMNPVYTGKDVSYIDTKQAQRAAETAATDAEKLATFAELLGAGRYPHAALDKVWRQLAYGAHHDAITGSESDQVYIDLVTGWREAHDLAAEVRDRALTAILARVDTSGGADGDGEDDADGAGAGDGVGDDGAGLPLTVANTLAFHRTDLARITVTAPGAGSGVRLTDDQGAVVPVLVEAREGERLALAFVARDVPPMGWRTWRLEFTDADAAPDAAADPAGNSPAAGGWRPVDGPASIANEYLEVSADEARGGALSSIRELATGRELLRSGALGNELRVYDEYSTHPEFGEGPWHLLPSGRVVSSAGRAAESVQVERSPAGRRLVVTGTVGEVRYEQRITLWHGLDRLDLRTRVLAFDGADRLLRVRFGCEVPGARPVSEVAGAVVGRGFGLVDVDSAEAPWTLDNPANTFFALSSTAHLRLLAPDGAPLGRTALGVAEVIVAEPADVAKDARALVVALGRIGVTATTATATGARYGWLLVDSNLPDLRIVLGGPDTNPFAREVLDQAPPEHAKELERRLAEHGAARLLVPARTAVEDAWVPNADLRAADALPVLIVAGATPERLAAEIEAVVAEFAAGTGADAVLAAEGALTLLDQHTVGILSRGMPGFAVDPQGGMQLSLLRSCTGWPSGVWLDPPLRRSPDGTAFQLQHWTHDFDYALVSGRGDWRDTGLVARGHEFSTPLLARTGASHSGVLPSRYSLLTVTPERRVHVQTVKPAGNPHAVGAVGGEPAASGVTVRLVETTGLPVPAIVETPFGWVDGFETDLLEQRRRGPAFDEGRLAYLLDGAQIATLQGVPGDGAADALDAGAGLLGPGAEAAQPVYSRYWLHNRGPAPMGFLPVSVAVDSALHRIAPGATVTGSVTVASHHPAQRFDSTVRVEVPPGWSADPAMRPLSLAADAHTRFPLTLTAPADAAPGLYFARVQLPLDTSGDGDGNSGDGGNMVEDVITLVVPGGALDAVLPPSSGSATRRGKQSKGTRTENPRDLGLDLAPLTGSLTLAPGERGRLAMRVSSRAASPISGEAMVVSPWGTWELLGPHTRGFRVEPGEAAEIEFAVSVPVDAEPGEWWAMVKLMWFGRVQYSAAVPLRVRAR